MQEQLQISVEKLRAGSATRSDSLRATVDHGNARIDLLDENGLLHWEYGAGTFGEVDHDPTYRAAAMPPDDGIAGLALSSKRPQYTGDYLADARFAQDPGIDAYVEAAGVRSVLAAPLFGDEGVFGTLYVVSRHRDAFGEADAEILEALASQAAVAITNARLVERIASSVVWLLPTQE